MAIGIGPVRGAFAGVHEERGFELLVHTRSEPKSVTFDGNPLPRLDQAADAGTAGWAYDPGDRRGVVRVRTPRVGTRAAHEVRLSVPRRAKAVDGGAYPPAPARDGTISANEMLVVARPAEEPGHPLENAFDGDPDTWFRTVRGQSVPYGPHEFVLALGGRRLVEGFQISPRNDQHWKYGNVRRYEVCVADVNGEWGAPVIADTLALADTLQTIRFPARAGRLLRFRILSTHDMGVDPMVLGASRAEADGGGAYSAADAVRVSPVTIGEFRVLEKAVPERGDQRTWLSDIAWREATAPGGEVTRNTAPDGSALRLFGLESARGLGVTGDSRIDYDLRGDGRVFRAEAGLADGAAPGSSVRFALYGDERLLWDSGVLGAGDIVKPVVDIRGVGILSLRTRRWSGNAAALWINPLVVGLSGEPVGRR